MSTSNWDMAPYFSAPRGDDYNLFTKRLTTDMAGLLEQAGSLPPLTTTDVWSAFLVCLEDTTRRVERLSSYLVCLGAADANDDITTAETAKLAEMDALQAKIFTSVKAVFRTASDTDFDTLIATRELAPIAYQVGRLREEAKHMMSAELEDLASDLGVVGMSAWGRLYNQVSGSLTFEHCVAGKPPETVPVAMVRSLLESPDENVRVAAFEGSSKAWEGVADTVAACLNGISGTRLALYERRGIEHYLAPAAFDAGISRATLDTMMGVVEARADVARDIYRIKAARMGRKALRWCDLSCPLPQPDQSELDWEAAKQRVLGAFGDFYPALGDFANHAFQSNWVDYTPRTGKRSGAFCYPVHDLGQSRVFMTYNGTDGDVQTLAHELGHAFHGWLIKDLRYWNTQYPMTLAETASTFAEAVVMDSMLASDSVTEPQKLAILEAKLGDAAVFMLNTPMRYHFERSVYERRSNGEMAVAEFKELMESAQKHCYSDVLEDDQLDPWFWASKLHFYITEISFYNFPYTFGYLFSLGLFARAKKLGPSFFSTYEQLLRATATNTAENVVKDILGVDLAEPEFWNESIDLIAADLNHYKRVLKTS